jgi:hypothetical protein
MNSSFIWSGIRSNIASALSSTPSGVSGVCTPVISSGSSITELICVLLRGRFVLSAQHSAWKCPSLPQLKHVHGRG